MRAGDGRGSGGAVGTRVVGKRLAPQTPGVTEVTHQGREVQIVFPYRSVNKDCTLLTSRHHNKENKRSQKDENNQKLLPGRVQDFLGVCDLVPDPRTARPFRVCWEHGRRFTYGGRDEMFAPTTQSQVGRCLGPSRK